MMSKYIPGNQKHLTLEDRIYIENELNKGTSFKDISRFLCKDPTTISKEVRAHRLSDWYHKGTFYNAKKLLYPPLSLHEDQCLRKDPPVRGQMHFLPHLQSDLQGLRKRTLLKA